MAAPDLDDLLAYLTDAGIQWSEDDEDALESALVAETAAQSRVCRVPESGDYPPDLAEALFRRVAVNRAVRALPLGYEASITEAGAGTTRVGGGDREVRRLEAPFRKVLTG